MRIIKYTLLLGTILYVSAYAVESKKVGRGAFKSSAGSSPQENLNFDISGMTWNTPNASNFPAATGGSGDGAISYESDTPLVCSVDGTDLTPIGLGTCTIRATKASSGVYSETSATSSSQISGIAQGALTITSGDWNGLNKQASAAGGSGDGAITWASNTPLICSINNSGLVTAIQGNANCQITGTKAASGFYTAQSGDTTFSFDPINQPAIAIVASDFGDGDTALYSASGGAGDGAATWSSDTPAICTVSTTGTVTKLSSGNCTINITKAASSNALYLQQTASSTIEVTVASPLLTEQAIGTKWKKITYDTSGGTGTAQRRAAATSACSSLGDGFYLANKTEIVNQSSLGSDQHYFSLSANRSYISSDCVLNTQNAGITSNACYGGPVNSWMDVALCKKP